nr:MAG: ORF1 [TTV-like mini virus]
MPYYWNRRNYWKRRRLWLRRRRARAAIRRRYRQRRYWVRHFKNFPKTLRLRQWNPKVQKRCYIKGLIPLFLCGKDRQIFNYIQYKESMVPENDSGGGGWSLMVFNLGGLYDEFKKLNNWWTADNDGLPLVKYKGCQFKFYQSWDTDYIVNYKTCPPMTDTELQHLDSHPSRMLMNKKAIVVPNIIRKQNKRRKYKKVNFPPPSLLKNQWFFQQDLCNFNLLMLTTSSCSLDQMYLPNNEVSNNITLISLNSNIFHNVNFLVDGTTGYSPKPNFHLWGKPTPYTGTQNPTNAKGLIYLGNLKTYNYGKPINSYQDFTKNENWGNPFHSLHGHEDTEIYYSQTLPTGSTNPENVTVTIAEELFTKCRYNPLKDTGEGNEVYFKSITISTGYIYDPPRDPQVQIHGYPLWLIMWGWTDWQEKLHAINQIQLNYVLIVKSKFITPTRAAYLFLDPFFTNPQITHMTDNDTKHWHPRFKYQLKSTNLIGTTGPASPRVNKSSSIQAHAFYKFQFIWGGCPAPMHNIKDPCNQSKFPVPNNQLQAIQATHPAKDPKEMLHDCDERRQTLTKKCIKRLMSISETPKTLLPGTNAFNPQVQQETTSEESSSEEEKETNIREQLLHIRKQHRKLKRNLKRLKLYQL